MGQVKLDQHTIRPVLLQRQIEQQFPGIWDLANVAHSQKGKKLKGWSEWCYLPVSVWITTVEEILFRRGPIFLGERERTGEAIKAANLVASLGAWRLSKGVYRFDPELYHELINTPISDTMPVNIFARLPEYCIYIETPGLSFKGKEAYGFFAFLNEDYQSDTPELRILVDLEGAKQGIVLPISDTLDFGTSFAGIYRNERRLTNVIEKKYFGEATMEHIIAETELLRDFALKILSVLLYLCSDEPDYGDRIPPARAAATKVKGGEKWIAAPGVKTWDVGIRIGAAIRKYRATAEKSESAGGGRHSPKRPHMRRAHWHGFWKGSRKEPEKQKFILHWIPPIPVKMSDADSPTVIRPVKE